MPGFGSLIGDFVKLVSKLGRLLGSNLEDPLRETSHASHIYTEGHRALTFDELVQEDDVVGSGVCSVRHMECLHTGIISELVQQHVVVSAEQGQAVQSTDEVLHHGVSD